MVILEINSLITGTIITSACALWLGIIDNYGLSLSGKLKDN